MNNIKRIRERIGVTQATLAAGIGCTQANVGHYERGQSIPPDSAKRIIEFAAGLGHIITYNDIYEPESAQSPTNSAEAAEQGVANAA